jgi:zinc protease
MRRLIPWLLLITAVAHAGETAPALSVPFERYTLPNGLKVILHEDHRLPQVVVNLWFSVGSKDEQWQRTGFAHLFEHLMFMGTTNVPDGKFDQIMENAGGQNNATTSEDRTNYFEFGPSHLLETFLWLEADRLASLPEAMTKKKVDLQRDVVKNERRQSYENRPYGAVELVVPEKMYPAQHPYHHPVIGSHADLTRASVEDVKSFFRRHYVPSNASLVIAGDFDPKEARKLVDQYFAWMPRVPAPDHAVPPRAWLKKSERVTLTDQVELPRVTLVWHSPEMFGSGDAEAELLAALLGGGKSSRLQKALVYEQKVASEVEVFQQPFRHGGNFTIHATAAPGKSAEAVEKALRAELTALDGKPPTEKEIDRARAYVQTHLLSMAEMLFGIADLLNQFEWLLGDPGQLERSLLARYASTGASDVAYAAHQILSKPQLTVVVLPKAKK